LYDARSTCLLARLYLNSARNVFAIFCVHIVILALRQHRL